MNSTTLDAFVDELEKIAIDPIAAAGLATAGKIGLTNALSRHAMRIPPIRWLGKEIAGVGVRTGLQGKPLMSRPIREGLAIGVDPKAVGVYESAYGVGQALRPSGLPQGVPHHINPQDVHSTIQKVKAMPQVRALPQATQSLDFLQSVPLESKGLRKVVDYGFTPVSQVGRDIGNKAIGAMNVVRGKLGLDQKGLRPQIIQPR